MGVLLMLLTAGGLVAAVLAISVSFVTKKVWLTKFVLGGVAIWVAIYTVILFGFSFSSTEKVLAEGSAKEFCGFYLDCHMHAAVVGVRTAKTIGELSAKGTFYIVKVRMFSDARNPAIAFRLLEPKARVVQADGNQIERDTAAEAQLPTASVRLDADINNKQTIEKEIVFDVVTASPDLKLLITEGYGIDKVLERILIGDEDSLFHAQTFFRITEQSVASDVR